ncbi:hypothetical protein KFK09_012091 [Dendrobium nobile]|uniref:Uncharacterized protein n=1 Tax=Dendrobium nobile TaxID=94219 RepID=A0A8T3BHU2_DENNO|nr:hypothetical protein KFK09_012091 [Dendrobium nobile]
MVTNLNHIILEKNGEKINVLEPHEIYNPKIFKTIEEGCKKEIVFIRSSPTELHIILCCSRISSFELQISRQKTICEQSNANIGVGLFTYAKKKRLPSQETCET